MKSNYLVQLDEYFCEQYSDYVKLSALDGYRMPDVVFVGADGNIARRDASVMRLCYQPEKETLLRAFKAGLTDTSFTFSFSFIPAIERLRDRFRKHTFAKLLPAALRRCNETAESAGEKLAIEPQFWKRIVKGKLYPEKNTVIALALVCRMQRTDVNNLFSVCGFSFEKESVRDVVAEFLLTQRIFNEEMRDACLAEYHITNLPIRRAEA